MSSSVSSPPSTISAVTSEIHPTDNPSLLDSLRSNVPTIPILNSLYIQYGTLVCVGIIGIVGNVGVGGVILLLRRLRKAANAFVVHHCALDLLKAIYCLIFATSLLHNQEPKYCNMLGGSFIVCVTSSAFNILAMVMSEAYVYADINAGVKDSGNYCCILFSISTIWFASIILNLGVAFLPGNPSYIDKVGHCTFSYGETRNYVLHTLWIVLVSFAILLAIFYLRKLHQDISKSRDAADLQHTVRNTLQLQAAAAADADADAEAAAAGEGGWLDHAAEVQLLKSVQRFALARLYTLLVLTVLFVMFWYPLFTLTLVDPEFKSQRAAYKFLTMFACCNSAVNPFVLICLLGRRTCCSAEMPNLRLVKASVAQQQQEQQQQQHKQHKHKQQQQQQQQQLSYAVPPPPPPPSTVKADYIRRMGSLDRSETSLPTPPPLPPPPPPLSPRFQLQQQQNFSSATWQSASALQSTF